MTVKINWKLRLQNKTTLAALAAAVVNLVYILLGIAGVVPPVTEGQITDAVAMALNLLVLLGVVVDPTTAGVQDSARALCYSCPADAARTDE